MNRIESRNNGIIKSVAALKDCSGRRAAGRFFFEGAHLLEEYLRSGRTPRALFVREDALARYSSLAGRAGCEVYEVTAPVYEKLTEEKAPQGILAVADTLPEIKEIGVSNAAEVIGSFGGGHAVVLENLQDPGNVGTIIRTAAAFGSSELEVPFDQVASLLDQVPGGEESQEMSLAGLPDDSDEIAFAPPSDGEAAAPEAQAPAPEPAPEAAAQPAPEEDQAKPAGGEGKAGK